MKKMKRGWSLLAAAVIMITMCLNINVLTGQASGGDSYLYLTRYSGSAYVYHSSALYARNLNKSVVSCSLKKTPYYTQVVVKPRKTGTAAIRLYAKSNDRLVQTVYVTVNKSKIDIAEEYSRANAQTLVSHLKKTAGRIGMKVKRSSKYPSLYTTGKKVTMGLNFKASTRTPYFYVSNTGNKKVLYKGVGIGMSSSRAENILKNQYAVKIGTNKYRFGQAGYFRYTVKSGKITGYTFTSYYTS